ncbi:MULTISPECIES: hypothetical protein [Microcystis]|uniref:Uncharacterized protein n=1 Tax=Microcystis panniformis FACHB-1757 TaxID=1638788 RepID=A0A0K1SA74_9CHRO|nr:MULTISPECIES: hypothetical protein [Microcystis]AKV70938.1 hypothetical protein VL20_6173 [Microcystis panniformis FACHB-1757]MDB9409088.1 hypothetical protein [Microcystis aeruginosa CS-558/01A06]
MFLTSSALHLLTGSGFEPVLSQSVEFIGDFRDIEPLKAER